jgi:hypothetical protein
MPHLVEQTELHELALEVEKELALELVELELRPLMTGGAGRRLGG